jgi:hypothetical protein
MSMQLILDLTPGPQPEKKANHQKWSLARCKRYRARRRLHNRGTGQRHTR